MGCFLCDLIDKHGGTGFTSQGSLQSKLAALEHVRWQWAVGKGGAVDVPFVQESNGGNDTLILAVVVRMVHYRR